METSNIMPSNSELNQMVSTPSQFKRRKSNEIETKISDSTNKMTEANRLALFQFSGFLRESGVL